MVAHLLGVKSVRVAIMPLSTRPSRIVTFASLLDTPRAKRSFARTGVTKRMSLSRYGGHSWEGGSNLKDEHERTENETSEAAV